MPADMRFVVVDADFFIKLTEYDGPNAELFFQLMDDLEVHPVMHKYVAEEEIKSCTKLGEFIREGKITVFDYCDYIDSNNQDDYESYFLSAFESMNQYDFPAGENIYEYKCEDESLGEIRSIYMAKALGYNYFMSDDGNAGWLAKSVSSMRYPLETWTVYKSLMECVKRGTSITLKALKPTIDNVFRKRRGMLGELTQAYYDNDRARGK